VLGSQIIFSFDIYLGQRSICRGGFNVTPIQIGFTFKATDGTEFVFSPAYGGGAECDVEVSHMREGQLEDVTSIPVFINRTKHKWKQTTFGEFEVRYMCSRQRVGKCAQAKAG
jgi:hypothetical protein